MTTVSLIKKRDAARILGVCPRTIDNLIKLGLPCIRLSRRAIRFYEADLLSWARSIGRDAPGQPRPETRA
ncbi:MAG TPA: helix-turn-helix domain-containing protein [Verrucomicrobiota bacterium]|nr:helix-turn-helix domain-containing protein [Verrucomicrobiota bacterium]